LGDPERTIIVILREDILRERITQPPGGCPGREGDAAAVAARCCA
jgi:hypothetical protein